jgi:hypothetical protein
LSGLPPFIIQPPWVKHIEKLEASVFPDCHTVERTWRIRKGLNIERHMLLIHHREDCRYDIRHVFEHKGIFGTQRL